MQDVQDVVAAVRRWKKACPRPATLGRPTTAKSSDECAQAAKSRALRGPGAYAVTGRRAAREAATLTDGHRAVIRAEQDALVLAMQAEAEPLPPSRHSGNPLMTAKLAG